MQTLSLHGKWNITSADNQYNLTGDVPGSLFYALEQRGDFGEEGLFYRENNTVCLDIANRDFSYTRNFSVPQKMLDSESIFLEADGLDALSEIVINGIKVAETNNMHRTWNFEITNIVQAGENSIVITFKNSLEFIAAERQRRTIFASDGGGQTSVPGFNMIRKSHCSYGWDWGPKVPDVGIWKDIKITAYDSARLKTVHVVQDHSENEVTLNLTPSVEYFSRKELSLAAEFISPDGGVERASINVEGKSEITIKDPQLWWPNGLGDQPLYTINFELKEGEQVIDTHSLTIGLRTLTIEQKQDEWGETFNYLCNGVSVFARGANYIPEDTYLNRNEPYSTERLIQDCVAANYNSMRVWGGGIYPNDLFFELCDKYGLIVWQDMMFACAIYDVRNDDFLENIQQELRDNLTRIRHHACIGLICGNNEMEWGFEEWGFSPTKEQRAEYLKQYQFVFPQIAEEICPELFYWPASPSSGGNFESPNSPDRGDCHYWDVWHGNKDFSEFKNHYFRFMSEFGFESFPSMKTIESFTEQGDRNIFSAVMEEHQKCIGGNGKILTYISKYFKYPKDLNSLVYVSQLSQAEAITTGIQHWRRNRGRCMGSIYWQVNDNWPVASWSSIDYYGRWKALHYAAKRTYDNVLVSVDGDEKSVGFHLSNESKKIVSGVINWQFVDFSGNIIDQGSLEASAQHFSSVAVAGGKIDFSSKLENNLDRKRFVTFTFAETDGGIYKGAHFFAPYKYLDLEEPNISAEITLKVETCEITITTDKPAVSVELGFSDIDVNFSDNYFHMSPGETRVITIPNNGNSLDQLKRQLQIRSLFNTY